MTSQQLEHPALHSLLQVSSEIVPTVSSVHVAGTQAAPAKVGALEDDGPSRKRARLKGAGRQSNKQPTLHGGTLIVAPTAVLNQWDQELAAKASPAAGRFCPTVT